MPISAASLAEDISRSLAPIKDVPSKFDLYDMQRSIERLEKVFTKRDDSLSNEVSALTEEVSELSKAIEKLTEAIESMAKRAE